MLAQDLVCLLDQSSLQAACLHACEQQEQQHLATLRVPSKKHEAEPIIRSSKIQQSSSAQLLAI